MIGHEFFYSGLSLMMIHEMDAIRCREWRIFPGLSFLDDKSGFIIFLLAHFPLFFLLFYGLQSINNEGLIKGLDYFFIIHFGLHLLFLMHKRNEFKDWISWPIITGTALCGFVDILIY